MKNKLKLLFAYFRAFKSNHCHTTIWFSYSNIEEWTQQFHIGSDNQGFGKQIEPAGFIIDIIEEIIKNKIGEFERYNDYEVDDYWNLGIDIYPFENRMVFTSECKVLNEIRKEKQFKLNDLDDEKKEIINKIYEDNGWLTKIEISFYGAWDSGDIYSVYYDRKRVQFDDDIEYLDLIHYFMQLSEGRWWNQDWGCEGDLTIWLEDIFLYYIVRDTNYEETEMNIELNLENVED